MLVVTSVCGDLVCLHEFEECFFVRPYRTDNDVWAHEFTETKVSCDHMTVM